MSKAKQYHLNFIVRSSSDRKSPEIICDYDSTGSTINGNMASFIVGMGPWHIDTVVNDILGEDPLNKSISEYTVWGGYDEVVEISSPPPRAVFNDGLEVPLQDFLDILQEWKDFLNSLPFEHTLSNR